MTYPGKNQREVPAGSVHTGYRRAQAMTAAWKAFGQARHMRRGRVGREDLDAAIDAYSRVMGETGALFSWLVVGPTQPAELWSALPHGPAAEMFARQRHAELTARGVEAYLFRSAVPE